MQSGCLPDEAGAPERVAGNVNSGAGETRLRGTLLAGEGTYVAGTERGSDPLADFVDRRQSGEDCEEWVGGAGGAGEGGIRPDPDGRADAGDGWNGSDAENSRAGEGKRQACAGGGADGACDEGRRRALPGGGHGRILDEAHPAGRAGPDAGLLQEGANFGRG